MRVVEIIQRPTDVQRTTLTAFVESVADATGGRPLSDHLWLDLRTGTGLVAVIVTDSSRPIAYAQISAANESSSLEAFVHPDVADAERVLHDAAETAIDAFAADGGGRLFWWVDDPSDGDREFAERLGLEPVRALHEMRRSLPIGQRSTATTRDFVPGVDDESWLVVNNRAFAAHGEQGGWTSETLTARMNEPWFDPTGFRVHDIDGRMAAFCWTKLHRDSEPVIGEIYVIAVDPEFHGRGLGKQLTLAGLDSIADRGVTTANLYVDADNVTAVRLYEGLGFTVHRTRQAFSGER